MNFNKLKQTEALFETLCEIRALQGKEQYAESLAITDKTLSSDALVNAPDSAEAKIHFLYAKAVALDMCDRMDEALPLFFELVAKYPGTPEFESSLLVVCRKLESRAKELLQKDPANPEIFKIHDLLEGYAPVPYWLIHAVASQEAADGKGERAWGRIRALIALSPNDSDYLKCALSLAKICAGEHEFSRLQRHVRALLEEHPWRLDLVGLIDELAPTT